MEEEKDKGTTALLAQTATKTFSDKIERTEWPAFCLEILDSQTETSDKDKMILGAINLISGLLPESLYSIYDRRKVYAPLYNILYGEFSVTPCYLLLCVAFPSAMVPTSHSAKSWKRPATTNSARCCRNAT